MDNYAEINLELPVTQFVKLEAKAKENFRSADAEASFLLSKWVESTQKDGAAVPNPRAEWYAVENHRAQNRTIGNEEIGFYG